MKIAVSVAITSDPAKEYALQEAGADVEWMVFNPVNSFKESPQETFGGGLTGVDLPVILPVHLQFLSSFSVSCHFSSVVGA